MNMECNQAFYNEIEPYAAEWMENLASKRHIANGRVDRRSICDIKPVDIKAATQAHFFAGLGGWSYALRLAGWPDDRPVWTGSCPCQPFSTAGSGAGFSDKRHLWPEWFRLIRECRPPVIFGEQVASPDALRWLDIVQTDLEGAGYAFAAADLCAAGVGAPYIRQRLYFVAVADSERRNGLNALLRSSEGRRGATTLPEVARRREAGDLADAESYRWLEGVQDTTRRGERTTEKGAFGRITECCNISSAGDTYGKRKTTIRGISNQQAIECLGGFWSAADWLPCRDSKSRPVEPGTFPLAHGLSGRVGRLRAYGNAIVPQVAATFVSAFMGIL